MAVRYPALAVLALAAALVGAGQTAPASAAAHRITRASRHLHAELTEAPVFEPETMGLEDSDETSSDSRVKASQLPGHGHDALAPPPVSPADGFPAGLSAGQPLIYRLCKLLI